MTIDGIDIDRLRCECGQDLCELDVRANAAGEIIVCPNCGNCARLEEREPLSAAPPLEFLRQQDIAPGDPGKLKGQKNV